MADYKYHIWLDGSIQLLESPKKLVETYMKEHDVCAFKHPDRVNAYQEADKVILWNLDNKDVVIRQIKHLKDAGYPDNHGLCETGVVARKNTNTIRKFSELWWSMINNFSIRDQLSFNYCLWKSGIEYNTFSGLTNVQIGSPIGSKQTIQFKLYNHE